mmetsp:Transcript_12847/g.17754  ORF Transcript_12847/g.17754 Transcript_12847/m.17754 type:complete len:119 (+) Transcript_12847:120-476(+)|eukprot:CAMPEP_0184487528 /NCGR_PEP_ID=MMETSP0113_2-20130426/10172_1 /TAXON_ID=91329 /ORGANISM="Norrisiella sphaerica, Strain BC52" /LENGTH=118 /DNA_ID=CAMNT_0026869871 /DNA_START=74 /DNA_END=430 /DNA_ORIENTATION=+
MATPGNFKPAMESMEDAEKKIVELLEIASQIMLNCSEVTPEGATKSFRLCREYVGHLKHLQDNLTKCIELSPVELENYVTCYEEHMRFKGVAHTCELLLRELDESISSSGSGEAKHPS